MPPKTQSFAVALQEGASPDNCVEHLDVPPRPLAWKPRNWLISDPRTRLVNGVGALKGADLDVAPGEELARLAMGGLTINTWLHYKGSFHICRHLTTNRQH